MKYCDFKTHTLVRGNPPHKEPYGKYRPELERDFGGRCAYCNLNQHSITTPFEIDHFIPEKVFRGVREELRTDYQNLVYACKKCNIAKSAKFAGDIRAPDVTNERFYDPVAVDYNSVFYRNEYGAIASDDGKGRRMIQDLKLYRPIHILGWLCEQLANTSDKLDRAIELETEGARREALEEARDKVAYAYLQKNRLFLAAYNERDFSLEGLLHEERTEEG